MKTYLCSLYNSSTGHYSPPMLFETKEQAITIFISEIHQPNSELLPIKNQLKIFAVGRFEHTTGKISPYLFKKLLISGTEVSETPDTKQSPNVGEILNLDPSLKGE